MSYPITKVSHSSVTRMVTGLRMAILADLRCVLENLKMNSYPMQIMVDSDTAMMVQSFTDAGISIDFDRLLKLMAENPEAIEDFIQEIETGDPRFMFPVTDSNMKRLIIEQTNKCSISPEQFLKGAVTILHSDNIWGMDSKVVH